MLQIFVGALCLLALPAFAGWTTREEPDPQGSGSRLEIAQDGKPVARFVFGDGQLKPFLHLYGESGELLTEWSPEQQFPHHRGIYIGWNRIRSAETGTSDLWHLNRGEKMTVRKVRHFAEANRAQILADIEWHAGKGDEFEDTILIKELRRLVVFREEDKTVVDARFTLTAQRDLTLDGDLQHAGVHFRASHKVSQRENETLYLWEPDLPGPGGKVASPDLKWCRFIFPVGTNWYSVTQLNAPLNPTAELSWRAYGRFGFFFKKQMDWGDSLQLNYRFITQPAKAPGEVVKAEERVECRVEYEKFLLRLKQR